MSEEGKNVVRVQVNPGKQRVVQVTVPGDVDEIIFVDEQGHELRRILAERNYG